MYNLLGLAALPKPQTQSSTVVLWAPRTLQRLNRCTQRSPYSHPTRATRPRGRIQTHSHPANPPQLLASSKDRQTRKPFLSLQRYPYNTADDVQVFNRHFPFICSEFEDMQTYYLRGTLEQLTAMQDCLFLFLVI